MECSDLLEVEANIDLMLQLEVKTQDCLVLHFELG